ncbi:putative amidase [Hyella patelloides LEGE 07179]|uniref:Putative amidase n=1 Tax=Hyella patelloides LEGE 07179 TaxID=945734 RepID=A0A563W467_9CYAN|nr:amidase [Hyella patelloides]VEP18333.1 putative amidase [Hyella patelloides LEGE 07179]
MFLDNAPDIIKKSALQQAELIRKRQISPLELTELYLNRIEQYNSQLGCFYHVAAEEAIADAQKKTEQLAQTQDVTELPPLFGVTTAIKDLNSVAEMPISYGVSALKDKIANHDDAIVTKLKNAGLTILGKTATSQLGSLPYTEPPGFTPTRNPWNLEYTAGGSSGGAAAAVAAGLCAVAQGSDGGGSIRGPAFCCGVVGLKPSRGRVSFAPIGDYLNGIASYGMLSRNVLDSAAVLDIISGYVPGDPYWLNDPQIPFLEITQQPLPQLRIAMVDAIAPFPKIHSALQQTVTTTANKLENLGHSIEPISLDITELIEPFSTIWSAGVTCSNIPLELLSPMNQWIASRSGSAGKYLQAVTKMQLFSRQTVSLFDRYDVLLLPTYTHPIIKVNQWAHLTPEETLQNIVNWIAPCPIWNATGQPAIAIPTKSNDELPAGVQLVGKPAQESTILALAYQLEQLSDFK